jgi:hypothetical protein
MSNTLLVTRPRHDETTNYLFYFAKEVIKKAEKKKFKIIDLEGPKANARDFSGRIKKTNPNVIFLNGHGNYAIVSGHNNEPLVCLNKNESLLSNKITYALSCSSAKELGKSAVTHGAKCFIGYDEDFVFLHEINKTTKPLEDKTAALFLEPSNLIMTTLIKGNSTEDAHKRSKEKFKHNLRKLLTSDSPQDDKTSVQWLYWDMKHQVCLGNKQAMIADDKI